MLIAQVKPFDYLCVWDSQAPALSAGTREKGSRVDPSPAPRGREAGGLGSAQQRGVTATPRQRVVGSGAGPASGTWLARSPGPCLYRERPPGQRAERATVGLGDRPWALGRFSREVGRVGLGFVAGTTRGPSRCVSRAS